MYLCRWDSDVLGLFVWCLLPGEVRMRREVGTEFASGSSLTRDYKSDCMTSWSLKHCSLVSRGTQWSHLASYSRS